MVDAFLNRTLAVKNLAELGKDCSGELGRLWGDLKALGGATDSSFREEDLLLLAYCFNEVGTLLRREKETWSREEPEFFVAYNLAAQKICSIPGAPHSLGKVDSGTAFPVNPADLWVAIAANLGFAGLDAGCARLGYVEGVFEDALRFCRNLSLPSESVQVLELQMGLAKAMAARRDPETANRAYELGREAYDIAEELLRDTRNNKKESAFMAYSLAPFFMDFIDICTFCGQPRMAALPPKNWPISKLNSETKSRIPCFSRKPG